jgi:hypothetical protein
MAAPNHRAVTSPAAGTICRRMYSNTDARLGKARSAPCRADPILLLIGNGDVPALPASAVSGQSSAGWRASNI